MCVIYYSVPKACLPRIGHSQALVVTNFLLIMSSVLTVSLLHWNKNTHHCCDILMIHLAQEAEEMLEELLSKEITEIREGSTFSETKK